MQRTMEHVFHRLAEKFGVRAYLYFDDIPLVSCYGQLQSALKYITKTDLAINIKKLVLSPRRRLTYLGFEIDLAKRSLKVTNVMRGKYVRALDYAARPLGLVSKFWQRLAGLINFVSGSLGLPAFWT